MMKEDLNLDIKFTGEAAALSGLNKLTDAERKRQGVFKETNKAFDAHIGQIEKSNTGYNKLNATLKGAGKAAIAFFAVQQFQKLATDIIDVTKKFEGYNNAIRFASGSAKEGEKNLEFLRKTVDKLGLDLEASVKGFQTLQASAKSAGVGADETREVFESVSVAVSAMNLKAEDSEGVFLALGQMLSKGTVQAEELRGQIGERLPGAFNIAAKSMGVTTQQLNKMLEQGQVISKDFLPKFAKQLREDFSGALDKSTQSLTANTNRLKNSFTELQLAVGEKFAGALSATTSGLAGMVAGLKNVIAPAETVEQKILAEQRGLNALVLQISSVNVNNKERSTLINKLNQEYPFFLKNLEAENISNSTLANRLREINELYIKRILVARQQERIEAVGGSAAAAAEQIRAAKQNILEQITLARQLGAISEQQLNQIVRNEDFSTKASLARQLVEKDIIELNKRRAKASDDSYFASRERNTEASKASSKEAKDLRSQIELRLAVLKVIDAEGAKIDNNSAKYDKALGVIKNFQDEIAGDVQALGDAFDSPATQVSEQAVSISSDNSKKILDIQIRRTQAQIILNQELLNDDKKTYNEKINLINQTYELELKLSQLRKSSSDDVVSAETTFQTEVLRADRARLEQIKALGVERVKQSRTIKDIQNDLNKEVESDFKDSNDRYLEVLKKRFTAEESARKEKNRREIEEETLHREQTLAIREEFVNQSVGLFSALGQLQSSNFSYETARLAAEKENQLELVGDNALRRTQIEKEFTDKEKGLRIKQAQSEKMGAVFSILTQTAINVVKALGTPPAPNFALAGITGAFGLAQSAIVGSKKIPRFYEGVDYLDSTSAPQGRDTILMYGDRGERILSKSENSKIPRWVKNDTIPELINAGIRASSNSNSGGGMGLFDFKNAIKEGLKEIPLQSFSLSENGFEKYVITKNSKNKTLNANYEY